jgi:hypothetical protein
MNTTTTLTEMHGFNYDYKSMRERLADNDASNYTSGYNTDALYKIMKEGIKGYDNMPNDELVSIHQDTFGFVDYKGR